MKKEKGFALIALGVVIAIFVGIVLSYISAANTANSFEQRLIAAKADSENVLGQYGQKIAEMVQVTDMARDDLIKTIKEAIGGRYGEDGSRAALQMIQEQNPSVDGTLYRDIQQEIRSGRTEFKTSQTRVLDIRQAYYTALGTVWTGFFMRMAGYPKSKFEDFDIVTTDRASEAFKTGKEAPIQLRPAK